MYSILNDKYYDYYICIYINIYFYIDKILSFEEYYNICNKYIYIYIYYSVRRNDILRHIN